MQATESNLCHQLLSRLSVRLGHHVNSGRFWYYELTESQAKLFRAVLRHPDMQDALNDWELEGCVNFYHEHGSVQVLRY